MVDTSLPHSVVTVSIPSVHLPWMAKRVGPGTYLFQHDVRRHFRNVGDKKHLDRGHVTVTFLEKAEEPKAPEAPPVKPEDPKVSAEPEKPELADELKPDESLGDDDFIIEGDEPAK